MTTMTLNEIESLADQIDEKLAESGGEYTEEIEQLFNRFDFAQRDKVDGYVRLIRHLSDRAAMAQQLADEYRAKAAAAEGRVAWLKQRLAWHMDRMGVREVQGNLHKAKYVANGGKAPLVGPGIENPLLLPQIYQKTVVEPDREKIRRDLGHDPTLDDLVRVAERGTSLRIY
jgi:BMFP domain-containing protein YqiC